MRFIVSFFYTCVFIILVLGGCHKRSAYVGIDSHLSSIPLFIEMPKNVLVFEHLSSMIYESLWHHFDRVGYNIQMHHRGNFCLATKIVNLEELAKLVSPDVLTYGFRMKLKLACELFAPDKTSVGARTFIFYKWIAKSKSPILHYHFIREQYKELVERSVPKIDHYFRKLLWQYQKQRM